MSWIGSLGDYFSAVLFCAVIAGGAIGYLDVDDDPNEVRRRLVVLIATILVTPFVLTALFHVLGTSRADAPGDWPLFADLLARFLVSAVNVVLAGWLPVTRFDRPLRIWLMCIFVSLPCAVIAAWPWLGADVPVWLRVCAIATSLGVAFALTPRAVRRR